MGQIFNRHEMLAKRRILRNSATEAEVLVWQRLKGKQVGGCKFRRQVSIGYYILDFYCPMLKLAIELDGASHDGEDAQEYDAIRQHIVEALDIRFLRFTNADIYDRLESVLGKISGVIEELTSPIQ